MISYQVFKQVLQDFDDSQGAVRSFMRIWAASESVLMQKFRTFVDNLKNPTSFRDTYSFFYLLIQNHLEQEKDFETLLSLFQKRMSDFTIFNLFNDCKNLYYQGKFTEKKFSELRQSQYQTELTNDEETCEERIAI